MHKGNTIKTSGMSDSDFKKPHRAWSFTLNNYTEEDCKQMCVLAKLTNLMVVSEEIGGSGNPHLQGSVIWKSAMRFDAVRERFDNRAHVEPTSAEDASATYCAKLGGRNVVCVDNRSPGKRKDLEDIKEAVEEGMRASEFARKKARGLQAALAYERMYAMMKLDICSREANRVTWIWGLSGLGKTRWVEDQFPMQDIYRKPPGKWWDNYRGEPVILMDDFRPTWFSFDELLRILDRYPLQVQYKGGSCYLQPAQIFITHTLSPEDAYSGLGEDLRQLTRRIHEVRHVE